MVRLKNLLIFIILISLPLTQTTLSENSYNQELSLIEKNEFEDVRIKLFKEIGKNIDSSRINKPDQEYSFSLNNKDKNSFFYGISEEELKKIFKLKTNKFNYFEMMFAIGKTRTNRDIQLVRNWSNRGEILRNTNQVEKNNAYILKENFSHIDTYNFAVKNYGLYKELRFLNNFSLSLLKKSNLISKELDRSEIYFIEAHFIKTNILQIFNTYYNESGIFFEYQILAGPVKNRKHSIDNNVATSVVNKISLIQTNVIDLLILFLDLPLYLVEKDLVKINKLLKFISYDPQLFSQDTMKNIKHNDKELTSNRQKLAKLIIERVNRQPELFLFNTSISREFIGYAKEILSLSKFTNDYVYHAYIKKNKKELQKQKELSVLFYEIDEKIRNIKINSSYFANLDSASKLNSLMKELRTNIKALTLNELRKTKRLNNNNINYLIKYLQTKKQTINSTKEKIDINFPIESKILFKNSVNLKEVQKSMDSDEAIIVYTPSVFFNLYSEAYGKLTESLYQECLRREASQDTLEEVKGTCEESKQWRHKNSGSSIRTIFITKNDIKITRESPIGYKSLKAAQDMKESMIISDKNFMEEWGKPLYEKGEIEALYQASITPYPDMGKLVIPYISKNICRVTPKNEEQIKNDTFTLSKVSKSGYDSFFGETKKGLKYNLSLAPNEAEKRYYEDFYKPRLGLAQLLYENKKIKNLTIIPFGNQWKIPFDLFIYTNHKGDNPKYLIERYNIKYHTSVQSYYLSKKKDESFKYSFVAFSNPNYKETIKTSKIQNLRSCNWQKLRFSDKEVRSAIQHPKFSNNFKIFNGEQASKENLTGYIESRVLHFAVHSSSRNKVFDKDVGPAIVLSTISDSEDGIVTLDEIKNNLKLKVDLVVLSSCESGLGENIGTDGLQSIANTFKNIGARQVMYTLWKVDDLRTYLFMKEFYKNYNENSSASTALRKTKLSFLNSKDPKKSDPFVWASFNIISSD